jgi:hypothetical protein
LFLGCEQGYTISGRVEETGTGNPIPYAVITFVQDGETIREILTNEYGFFSESGFTGTVQVQASKPGFAFAGEGYTVTGPRELLFSGTGTTYSVSGKVIDQESYKGLSGALITFELLDESGNPTGLEIDAQSDEDGQFFLSGLSGEYTVTASLPGFTFSQIHRVSKETHGLTFQGTRETHRVIGKVVLAGREDEGIGAVEVTFEGDHGLTRSTVTTAQGNFQLSDLSGPGWVTAAKEGWDFEPQKGHYVQGETTGLRFFGSYKVDGYVLTESGEPVEGAEVTFMADGAVLPEFTATTNAQGYFSVSGLTTTYSIEVSTAGFAFEDGPEVSGPTSVEVRGTYEVTVVVKDVNGEAIPGATIYVKRNGITYDIVTTSDGKMGYTLKGLEGPVEIEVLKTGWQFTPAVSIDSSWAGRAIIFEGRDLTEPTEPTYTVSGTVTAGDNHPVANVTVVFEGNDVRVEATTDSEGKFTLVGVRGIGVIKASKAGYAFDAYPVDVESNMTDIELKGTYMIIGKVIDKDGKGVGSVKIVVEEVPAKYTFSDSSGQFTLAGLEGAVTLVPVKDDVAFDPEFVEVTGPDDSPVFKLLDQTVPTYTVSGRVVDEYGDPIPEVQVQALRPANGNGSSGDDNGGTESENDNGTNVVAETWTDLDGHYTLEGLQGTVMIKLTKSGHTFTEKTVSAGTSNLDFLGTLEGYTVSGRVFDDDGSQLAGVLVTAVNDKGETWTTTTDSSGAYKLNGLKRTNTIRAEKTGYVFEQVHSVSDSTAGLHFYGRPDLQSYKAAGKIWLTGTANPVLGVEVRITFIDSSRSPFKVVTNSEGEWEVDGLAGKVMIVPQKPGWVFDPASRGITGEDLYVNFSGTYGSGD